MHEQIKFKFNEAQQKFKKYERYIQNAKRIWCYPMINFFNTNSIEFKISYFIFQVFEISISRTCSVRNSYVSISRTILSHLFFLLEFLLIHWSIEIILTITRFKPLIQLHRRFFFLSSPYFLCIICPLTATHIATYPFRFSTDLFFLELDYWLNFLLGDEWNRIETWQLSISQVETKIVCQSLLISSKGLSSTVGKASSLDRDFRER